MDGKSPPICLITCCRSLLLFRCDLGCTVWLWLRLRAEKMTNGEISPEEKKQEMEKEKLPEDASAGENQRWADGEKKSEGQDGHSKPVVEAPRQCGVQVL